MKISKRWNWLAKDKDGRVFVYKNVPYKDEELEGWDSQGVCERLDTLLYIESIDNDKWYDSLYQIINGEPVKYIILEKDDLILVSNDNDANWFPRYFSNQGAGCVYCFLDGRTSKTVEDQEHKTSWKFWKPYKQSS